MQDNKNQGRNKPKEHQNKQQKGSAQTDGFRYDYTDSSDFKNKQ
ncbi:hypothetical protein [Ornithinibacillus xuwenensis]|jgi:hypothetical protein|uniref:Glycogen biosynthesis protein GlgD n=1 Tax=Ornithinibacillus xuwenensis TaxID=3144668 RepID=A0ABU9XIA5_9BACI